MALILANDGIDASGRKLLEIAGHMVITDKVAQSDLANFITEKGVSALLVRSATEVTSNELCTGKLKVVGRAGVGMDNIDLKQAEKHGIAVVNTPASSSRSVAELVMAHTLGLLRFLPESNRRMPESGNTSFGKLKKAFAEGREVEGRTMGIIGFGRIGRCTAQLALGMGMKVIAYDPSVKECSISLTIHGFGIVNVPIAMQSLPEVLTQSDVISLHVPKPKNGAVIGTDEFAIMKSGAIIINASRGGVIDEEALIEALNSGKIAGAGLDVFDSEPEPDSRILQHPRISLTPHIGASTQEAQERIGIELAEKVLEVLGRS
jgi:D-3-phosphoglycerate dehydrogenase